METQFGTAGTAEDLLGAAMQMPLGPVRLETIEQAVRLADSLRDTDAGFACRQMLIDEAGVCNRYELLGAAFSWCLATARREPERYAVFDVLERYQNTIGIMVNFAQVSREQYAALLEDVIREFRAYGLSLRMVYLRRRCVGIDFGDPAMAAEADREWRKHPRDLVSASVEFEQHLQLDYECFLGDSPAAVRVVDAYFARAKRDQHADLGFNRSALLPLLRVGRGEEAAVRYKTVARNTRTLGYSWDWGYCMEYLAHINDFPQGLKEFENQLPAAMAQTDGLSRYYFLRPAAFLFQRLAASGMKTAMLKAQPLAPWGEKRGAKDVAVVGVWLRTEAASIAAQFDRRNGNDFYTEWLDRTLAEPPHAR